MIRSGGGRLTTLVEIGEPGDVFVVLDREGRELGRGIARAKTGVIVTFDPPVQLPRKGDMYRVKKLDQADER